MTVEPIQPPYTDEQTAILQKWMPPGAPFEPLMLFRIFAVHPALMAAFQPLGRFGLSKQQDLSLHERELVILRVCALNNCEYEWGVHVTGFAEAAELSKEQVKATCDTVICRNLWDERDYTLLSMVSELLETGIIADATKPALKRHFTDQAILTITALTGWYSTISLFANNYCADLEKWADRFPKST